MLFNSLYTQKKLALSLLFLVFICSAGAQSPQSEVYKKYVQKDSSALNRSAILVFYSDNTFINCGIFDDKASLDLYLWYSTGTWNEKNGRLECQAVKKVVSGEDLKKKIVNQYKTHPDRPLIEKYYEFVNEPYRNGSLLIGTESVIDGGKKIDYVELKL